MAVIMDTIIQVGIANKEVLNILTKTKINQIILACKKTLKQYTNHKEGSCPLCVRANDLFKKIPKKYDHIAPYYCDLYPWMLFNKKMCTDTKENIINLIMRIRERRPEFHDFYELKNIDESYLEKELLSFKHKRMATLIHWVDYLNYYLETERRFK